jgi:hypothetical protein
MGADGGHGANLFAVARPEGGWEVIQARKIVLVEAGLYEMRGLLRGLFGSAPANSAPSAPGAAIVRLEEALARVATQAHERGQSLSLAVAPPGLAAGSADAFAGTLLASDVWARPFAPVHLRARREASGAVAIIWVRQTRMGGDFWGPGEPELGETSQLFRLEILSGEVVKRTMDVQSPTFLYATADQISDFGNLPASFGVRVAQVSQRYGPGRVQESVFTV